MEWSYNYPDVIWSLCFQHGEKRHRSSHVLLNNCDPCWEVHHWATSPLCRQHTLWLQKQGGSFPPTRGSTGFGLSEIGSPPLILYFPAPSIYLQILRFHFSLEPNKIMYIYHILVIHLAVDGYPGCFHFLAVGNKAATIDIRVFLQEELKSFDCLPRIRTAV